MTNAIICDGPAWWYSASSGTLYINGLQWCKLGSVSLTNTYTVECYMGKTVDFVIKLENATDISSHSFVVRYNPADLDVIDLCSMTSLNETAAGGIHGIGITILEYSAGVIRFKMDKPLEAGRNWSGIVNTVKFKSQKSTGQTSIEYEKM